MTAIAEQRAHFASLFTRPIPAGVEASETTLGGRPALALSTAAGGDVLLYFHGGGFVVGSARSTAHLPAALVRHLDGRAISLDYRLAPEHPYPAAPDDCLAAYRELLDSGLDARRVVFAGDSAGAALAVTTMLRARDAGLPLPAAAVLFSPAVDLTVSGETMRTKNGVDPIFTPDAIAWLFGQYLDGADAHEASPLFGDLAGLPPLLIQAGSSELLLDDAVRLAGHAASAEVAVTLEVAPRQPHVFQHGESPEAVSALERAGRFLATRLQNQKEQS
ncbi:alpha/beta hydrolase [Phytomonospora endophytica]|uniref:Acetyl esterase/lipase n=1 Tax=Phytomonospora endophytica TaxID=714109 RepID=A0A841G3G6_9ACTN|nr:alpha/beta hydrolase [Phytomonospora endophytica]MBB6038660.1 acetyl esterase/lipase [Phytomonospora endophytica]GIG69196.1 alpha/beta hydrolase [Phytomonospora endophytica]